MPAGVEDYPFEIIHKQRQCNVTITKADHGLVSGNTVFLQFLPNNQGERANIIMDFANSKEYYGLYGSTESSFVRSLYKNILGREPDTEGFKYWTDQIGRAHV